jgi:hypothetical protein
MPQSIYNMEVAIEVSDPWEFGTAHGTGPFDGHLMKLFSCKEYNGDILAVLRLDTPLDFKGMRYEFLLAQARHTNVSVADIENGNQILCNISAISKQSAAAVDPLISSKDDPHAIGLVGSVVRKKKSGKSEIRGHHTD